MGLNVIVEGNNTILSTLHNITCKTTTPAEKPLNECDI